MAGCSLIATGHTGAFLSICTWGESTAAPARFCMRGRVVSLMCGMSARVHEEREVRAIETQAAGRPAGSGRSSVPFCLLSFCVRGFRFVLSVSLRLYVRKGEEKRRLLLPATQKEARTSGGSGW